MKLPEIQKTMMEMSREMMKVILHNLGPHLKSTLKQLLYKAGIIEEMLEDTMEGLGDEEELEDEVQVLKDFPSSSNQIDN